jgi:hypothetical protein
MPDRPIAKDQFDCRLAEARRFTGNQDEIGADCRITVIDKTAMIDALEKQPWFYKMFMEHLLERDRQIEGDVMDQLFSSKEQRLARLLLDKMDVQRTVLRNKLAMNDGNSSGQ